VTFFTGRHNIFYLELATDRTEFIRLYDFEPEKAPDPDELIAQANRESRDSTIVSQQTPADDSDDLLRSLGM
jgi:hypothetical protein